MGAIPPATDAASAAGTRAAPDAERNRAWCNGQHTLARAEEQRLARLVNLLNQPQHDADAIAAAAQPTAQQQPLLALRDEEVQRVGRELRAHWSRLAAAGDRTAALLSLMGDAPALRQQALAQPEPLALMLALSDCEGQDRACGEALVRAWLRLAPQQVEPWIHAQGLGLKSHAEALAGLAAATEGQSQRLQLVHAMLARWPQPATPVSGLRAEAEVVWLRERMDRVQGAANGYGLLEACRQPTAACRAAGEALWRLGELGTWRHVSTSLAGDLQTAPWAERRALLKLVRQRDADAAAERLRSLPLGRCDSAYAHGADALRLLLPEAFEASVAALPPPGAERERMLARVRPGKPLTDQRLP